MSVILLNQAIIHYESLGRGRPVVFLHSWVGSWHYWIGSMQAASRAYRAYALDLYGYGETTHDPHLYSIESQVDLVRGFMDELGIAKAALVGHGLGALIALSLAARQPERVARILAVGVPVDSFALASQFHQSRPADLIPWLSGRGFDVPGALADASRADPLVGEAALAGVETGGVLSAAWDHDIPLLLANGGADPSVLPPSPDRALLQAAHVHHVLFDEIGHFPMLEAEDRFQRLLLDFLALDSGTSPRQLQFKEEWRRRVR